MTVHRRATSFRAPSAGRDLCVARRFARAKARGSALRAFTLVELLVVIVIIAVLISAVLVASSTLINKARTSNTQAMLTVVRDAVEQFRREQQANPTLTRLKAYSDPDTGRYGRFPPDEFEVFCTPNPLASQLPGWPPDSLAVGGAEIVPAPEYETMKFYTAGIADAEERAKEHRDLAAMIVAIELFGDASSAILDRIQDRYWRSGPLDQHGNPALFLDRPQAVGGPPNGSWDPDDLQIRYIIDDWGMPISYLAQRDWKPGAVGNPTASSNHPEWNEASTELIRLNGDQPVILSYGPNGKEQLTEGAMGTDAAASLVGDFESEGDHHHKVDYPLNADNVYANPALKERLATGIAE